MRVVRLETGVSADAVRELAPARPAVDGDVRAILARVRAGGDAAVAEVEQRFGIGADPVRVESAALAAAWENAASDLRDALAVAIENVEAVARASLVPSVTVELSAGHTVAIDRRPVARAGIYAPGGRAPYPSTVVMGAVTARVAGVEDIVLCSPPTAGGAIDALTLAAAASCGVDEVYAIGGAQAIAALAYGTETIERVDLIAGPGNPYVTEAKRQLVGIVGIDGLAGPSELVVVAAGDLAPRAVALDLLAQAEHGLDSLIVLIGIEAALVEQVVAIAEGLAAERGSVTGAPLAVALEADLDAALAFADVIAPEHLQLVGSATDRAAETRRAGCVLVGNAAGTAFGDYVAGSNHVLPTGGAARFQGPLSVSTFTRPCSTVTIPESAAARLAPSGAVLARAEGFPVHAESMEERL